MKYLLSLSIIFLFLSTSAINAQDRRRKIVNIINQEINEVQRISNQTTGYNPAFELRKAELFLEKARLERELENEQYLKIDPRKRNQRIKNSYFKKSSNSFLIARQTCQQIIKKAPRYEDIGDVYYILAYYSKEKGDYNQALRNFNQSRRLSKSSELVKRSEIAMAEIFYSNNRCDQSIKLYKKAIPRTNNKWKTKDLYNYSWCLYKTGQTNSAIRTMKESYRLSQQDQYINMSERIKKDIIVFYVQAKEYDQALNFINNSKGSKKIAVDELVSRLSDGGETNQAANLLKRVINKSSAKEKPYYMSKLYMTYQNTSWGAAQSLVPNLVSYMKDSKLDQPNQIRSKAVSFISYLQNVLLKNKIDSDISKKKMAVSAYKHAQLVQNPKASKAKIGLVLAEIFQSIGEKKTAYDLYIKSFQETRNNSDYSKINDSSLEGALLAVDNTNDKDLEKVYEYYLSDSPRGNKKQIITEKLFQIYMNNNKPQSAQKLLRDYQRQYPSNINQKESMLAQLFEYYEKKKSYSSIQKLIRAINSNQIRVSSNYKSKINLLSNNLIQKKANLSLKKGDWLSAIENYKKAYNINTDSKLKSDSALNIASLYSQNKKIPESIIWLQNALKTMNSRQVQSSSGQINILTSKMFYQGYIDQSVKLQQISWNRSCNIYSLFENLFVLTKASLGDSEAVNLLIKAKRCRSLISKLRPIAKSFIEELKKSNNKSSVSNSMRLSQSFGIQDSQRNSKIQFLDIVNLSNLISSSVLSSQPEKLVVQVRNLLNRLAKINSMTSKIQSSSPIRIKAFSRVLKSYNDASFKIKSILQTNKDPDLKTALLPVIQTLKTQKLNVFSSAMKIISQTPNYSLSNHELLINFNKGAK